MVKVSAPDLELTVGDARGGRRVRQELCVGKPSHTTDVFLPVKTDGYDPKAPGVFVRISNVDLKDAQWTAKPLEGTLAREPLPTLARRSIKSGGAHAPTFAIVFEHQRGVFGYWFGILLAHLVPFGVYALNRLYWAPKEKAAKAAEAKETPPPAL